MPIAVVPQHTHSAAGVDQELTENSVVKAAVWNAEDPHSDLSAIVILHEAVRVGDLRELAGSASTEIHFAVPLDSPPRRGRRALSALFRSIDGHGHVAGIDAPVAAFANSLHLNPNYDSDRPLRVVSIGHSDGCSMVVGHAGERRLVAIGLVDGPDDIERWTHKAARFSQLPLSIEVPSRWSSTLSRVGSVTTHGLTRARRAEFDALFGSLTVHHSSDGVLDGLTRLETLCDWSACWPTTRVHLGLGWTRQPGPIRADVEEHVVRLRSGAHIRFSDDGGRPVAVRAGSLLAPGCVIPEGLGAAPRLRLIDDGQLLMVGPPPSRPLAMKLSWPIPGSGRNYVGIRSASESGVELIEPLVGERVHATVEASPR
jgi:hypothetical protein